MRHRLHPGRRFGGWRLNADITTVPLALADRTDAHESIHRLLRRPKRHTEAPSDFTLARQLLARGKLPAANGRENGCLYLKILWTILFFVYPGMRHKHKSPYNDALESGGFSGSSWFVRTHVPLTAVFLIATAP